ncbi:MAG TPA: hypothetical protein VFS67_35320 [Polyangiaceae bacterium]|nr:hypothetical protein [Polyangiaceae bacterium]
MRGAVRVGIWASLLIGWNTSARAAELQARGPAECPEGAELAFRVERNAQVALALAPPVTFDVAMERAAAGYVARVRVSGGGADETKERVLSAADCAELSDAIVVAVTLALGAVEPVRAAPSEAPAAVSELAPAAQGVSADEAPATGSSQRASGGLRPSLSLSALIDAGSLPAPAAGAALQASVAWGRFELRALGLLLFEQHTEMPGEPAPASGADLRLFAGALLGCTAPFAAARAGLTLPACLGFELGGVSGVGTNVSSPRSGSALWAAPRVDLGAVWSVPDSTLNLSLTLTGAAPLQRSRFTLTEIGTVYTPSSVVGRLSLGVGLGFD